MATDKKVILYERYELFFQCQDEKQAKELESLLGGAQSDKLVFTSVKIETQGKIVVLRSVQPDKAKKLKRWAVGLAQDQGFIIEACDFSTSAWDSL